jgi:hypothetical protein
MPDPTADFFAWLGRHGSQPLLEEAAGTIRFDLRNDHGIEHWFLEVRQGTVLVSRDDREADCVVHANEALFDRLVRGEAHIYPAWLRNDLRVEGDLRLARLMQRVFPGRPGAHDPRAFARERRRRV